MVLGWRSLSIFFVTERQRGVARVDSRESRDHVSMAGGVDVVCKSGSNATQR